MSCQRFTRISEASFRPCRWRRPRLHEGVGRLCCTVLFPAIVLGLLGCAATPKVPPVELTLTLNAASYQIGEPVLATVRFANESQGAEAGGAPIVIPALDESTLKFHLMERGSPVPMRRRPVLPEKPQPEARTVAAHESVSRTFLFTRLTAEPGEWALQVALSGCESQGATVEVVPAYYSRLAEYHVTDKVMFKRDPNSGLITREQATALARERAGQPEAAPARAVLVPIGETGLYEWTLFMGEQKGWPEDGMAFTVNPYSGAVEALKAREPDKEGRKG